MDMVYSALDAWYSGTWHWFNTLSREEWVLVLAVGCTGGFLCMRGFGTRGRL